VLRKPHYWLKGGRLQHENSKMQDLLLLKRAISKKDGHALEALHSKYYCRMERYISAWPDKPFGATGRRRQNSRNLVRQG
jgi:hypothetical protein